MKPSLLIITLAVVLTGCRATEPKQAELLSLALAEAGPNRSELERALDHYATEAPDSARLTAARYLVANMPGHYTLGSSEDSALLSKIPELAALSNPYGWDPHLSTTVRWADSVRSAIPARFGGADLQSVELFEQDMKAQQSDVCGGRRQSCPLIGRCRSDALLRRSFDQII